MALIHEKICAIQKEISAIGKNDKNKNQNYNFRGIDTVYNELHNLLAKHDVFSAPEVIGAVHEERASKSGGVLIYRILTIKYNFFTSDGSTFSATVIGEGMDSGDKASNKSMSVAHKYALLQVFTIPTSDPKDPENESPEPAPRENKTVFPITEDQAIYIQDLLNEREANGVKFFQWLAVKNIESIPSNKYDIAVAELKKKPMRKK